MLKFNMGAENKSTREGQKHNMQNTTYALILDGLVPPAPPIIEMLLIFTSEVNLSSEKKKASKHGLMTTFSNNLIPYATQQKLHAFWTS